MNLEPKTIAQINSLYRRSKVTKWLCVIGIFIPLVLIIAAGLGLLYWSQRRKLLALLNSDGSVLPLVTPPSLPGAKEKSTEEKISYIRKSKLVFIAPAIILVIYVLMIASFVMIIGKPIDIVTLRECDFIEHQLNQSPQLKSKVTIDKNVNIVIDVDATVSDPDAFRASFENLRNGTTDYVRHAFTRHPTREAQPFVVRAKNLTITIP